MTFEVCFRDFRGFHRQAHRPIRPITILVGENSAGKTSFLAGLKYLQDFLSGRAQPSFNEDPFQLGTFDQISHFRGGRWGRASEFEFSFRQTVALRKSRYSDISGNFPVEFKLFFNSIESHATVTKAQIFSENKGLEASITDEGVQTFYLNHSGERLLLDEAAAMPPIAKIEFARYWPFLLRDLQFRLKRRSDGDSQTSLFPPVDSDISLLSELAENISRRSATPIIATSAIRTRPQRTYTPGTEKEDGEGSHVPYEIAKLFRARNRNKDDWTKIKRTIEEFGAQSGMFKEISVKSFGQTASDPFQIQFSSGGPKMNLVDLGYGTSQILPILYSIANGKRGDRLLVQQPEVHLHPQAQAALGEFFVNAHAISGLQFVLETHSDFIVDRVRNAIARGLLKKSDVSLLFFARDRLENRIHEVELDDRGDPVDPPQSYRSFFIDEQMKMLGLDSADNY